jgi:hypothetical protein
MVCVDPRKIILAIFFIIAAGIFMPQAQGQAVAVAEVDGRVTDATGAGIPNAQVKMVQLATQQVHTTNTGFGGRYQLPDLPVGAYRLEVGASGFKNYIQNGIVLQVANNVEVNVTMQLGAVSESIEVTANASMVETKDSGVAQVVDQSKVVDLPLNGRNLTQLLVLAGGGTTAPAGDLTGSKNIQGSETSGTFSVAGSQANGVNYLMDGGDNNDAFSNVNLPIPFPDAVQEFSVQTNALSAQFGLHPGGVVNIVTKSGANAFHGDFFDFLRNYELNARQKGLVLPSGSVQQPTRDSLKRNQYGGTVGGRIIRDKVFFFGGYQQTTQRSNPSNNTAHVPTALTAIGNFSVQDALVSAGGCQQSKAITVKDPATGTPFPGNVIPVSRFDPAATKLLSSYIPQSTDPCGVYLYAYPTNNPDWQIIGRVDYVRSEKHALYARYFIYNYTALTLFDGKNALTTGSPGNKDETNSVTLGDTYTFNSTSLNSFHATFTRRADNRGSAPNLFGPNTLGIQGFQENMPNTYMQITVTNYFNVACGTCAPGYFNDNVYQVSDDYQMTRGKHQLSIGVDFRKLEFNSLNNQQANGQWTFSGNASGDGLADLELGKTGGLTDGNALSNYLRQKVFGAYIQDTWRVGAHLTLNLGVRWEPTLPSTDKQCRGDQFSMSEFLAGYHSTQYPNAPAGLLFGKDSPNSNGCRFSDNHWLSTSPRVGLVWDPTGSGKQSIRVAGALMHDQATELFYPERLTTNPPYASSVALGQNTGATGGAGVAGPFSNPWLGVPGGDPFPGAGIFPLSSVYVSIPPNVKPTYMLQWNASYQRQLGKDWLVTATYLGNRTNHILGANNINVPQPSPTASTGNEAARRTLTLLNPAQGAYYASIVQTDAGANASYNGLLVKAEHRFATHYTWLTNYTYSHCISTWDFGNELAATDYQNATNRRAEKADCNFDRRHIFNSSLVATSGGLGHGIVLGLTKDWQVAPIVSLYTGQTVNITDGTDVSLTGDGLDRPDVVSGVTTLTHTLTQWFNPAAFAKQAPGTFGNAGRDLIHGPGTIQWDMSLSRQFRIGERWKLEFRGDFFNIMNHANWNNPSAALNSATFGEITTFGAPRLIQLAMKAYF